MILVDELAWYCGYYLDQGWFTFPARLPLQLCDIIVAYGLYSFHT